MKLTLILVALALIGCSTSPSVVTSPAQPPTKDVQVVHASDVLDALQSGLEKDGFKFEVDSDGARRVVEVNGVRYR